MTHGTEPVLEPAPGAVSEDEEIVQAFLEESRENLDQLDRDLVDLESRPSDPALLAQVFRTIHTIKGTCGFLGYHRLEALTHAGESLLGELRDGTLTLDRPVTTSLLDLVDATRSILRQVATTGTEGTDDHAAVVADLVRHRSGPATTGVAHEPPATAPTETPVASDAPGPGGETSVRIDVAVLDKLLDLVGELVLVRSQLGVIAVDDEDGPLAQPYRQLRLVTRELQDGVMRARLQPVGTVTGKFHRVARDLAAALDKQVRVELGGEDVGVDKAVNEALRAPLLHLVRNAVDHGLEPAAERLAAGKPPEGLLRIRAYHEGGRVQVEVSDDGRGIDGDRLVALALAAGRLTAEEAAGMTATQRLELVFRPGLSTKEEVTSVSGRGVGMDVVRTDLEQVGGSIEVASDLGRGSVFMINVPLTLAIMPALVVWCGGLRYAIPQVDTQEVVHLEAEEVLAGVDHVEGARLYRLRGRLLPLVDLAGHLGVAPLARRPGLDVVVVRNGGRRFGLVVDAVGDTIEAVVKPLPRAVRSVPVFAGVTLLGDGQPSLILDVAGLAGAAGVGVRADETPDEAVGGAGAQDAARLLIAKGAGGVALAFPLGAVLRLEQFGVDQVERVGNIEVVQYGDILLPLIRVGPAPVAASTPGPSATFLDAVVCLTSAGPVGLVVDHIEDVVAAPPVPSQPTIRSGLTPCLVVDGRVTELVDVEALVTAAGLAGTG